MQRTNITEALKGNRISSCGPRSTSEVTWKTPFLTLKDCFDEVFVPECLWFTEKDSSTQEREEMIWWTSVPPLGACVLALFSWISEDMMLKSTWGANGWSDLSQSLCAVPAVWEDTGHQPITVDFVGDCMKPRASWRSWKALKETQTPPKGYCERIQTL